MVGVVADGETERYNYIRRRVGCILWVQRMNWIKCQRLEHARCYNEVSG